MRVQPSGEAARVLWEVWRNGGHGENAPCGEGRTESVNSGSSHVEPLHSSLKQQNLSTPIANAISRVKAPRTRPRTRSAESATPRMAIRTPTAAPKAPYVAEKSSKREAKSIARRAKTLALGVRSVACREKRVAPLLKKAAIAKQKASQSALGAPHARLCVSNANVQTSRVGFGARRAEKKARTTEPTVPITEPAGAQFRNGGSATPASRRRCHTFSLY